MKKIILLIVLVFPAVASAGLWDGMKWDQDSWDTRVSAMTLTVAGLSGNSTGTITGGNSISCSIAADGAVSGTCTERDNNGARITLTATPAAGSSVVWSGCSASVNNICYVTLSSNLTVSASFTLYSFNITASPGTNGRISCNPMTVNYNHSSACTITPDTGYYVSDVQVGQTGGALSSVGATTAYTISNITSDTTISATFAGYPVDSSNTFADVPIGYWAEDYIYSIYNAGITAGCGNNDYCPESPVLRDQMAVFIIKLLYGAEPTCSGGVLCKDSAPYFTDVSSNYWAFKFIQKMKETGITAGCGNGNYCPEDSVTREQMAVFITKALNQQAAPSCTGIVFNDVNESLGDGFCRYIEEFKTLGITSGCGNNNYCPYDPITRAQMAVFLTKAFLQ